jgi:hypothetical protein
MELFAESYQRFFDLPTGRIGAMADIHVEGDLIELRDLILYPIGVEKLEIGVRQLLFVRRQIEIDVRGMGYVRLRITADRISGANPGRAVHLEEKL